MQYPGPKEALHSRLEEIYVKFLQISLKLNRPSHTDSKEQFLFWPPQLSDMTINSESFLLCCEKCFNKELLISSVPLPAVDSFHM